MNAAIDGIVLLPRIEEALELLDYIQKFAYEHGYHECGYDPVKRLREELESHSYELRGPRGSAPSADAQDAGSVTAQADPHQ